MAHILHGVNLKQVSTEISKLFKLKDIRKRLTLFQGFRTRSHYEGEPVERFTSIDLYRRPPTNQPGNVIFDHGRATNGYFLQRNQCL